MTTFVYIITALTLIVACADNTTEKKMDWITDSESGQSLPGVNPHKVTGDIITAGSSTVFPLAEHMGSLFRDEGYTGNLTIDSIGSGAGFERFTVAGETDIVNASRPIKDKEIENAGKISRTPLEFRIGTDALTVIVPPRNNWVDSLSMKELAQVFTAEFWSDVNAAWPDEAIQKFIPGTDSGTFDYFVEEVFDEDPEPLLNAPHIQASEDDNILVRGIEGSDYAIGFFGYAYYAESADRLKAIKIDGVAPARSAVDSGTYPLARPLFMYSDAEIMRTRPQVAAFLAYVLTYVNEEITEVGYFPAPDAALDEGRQRWLDTMKNTY